MLVLSFEDKEILMTTWYEGIHGLFGLVSRQRRQKQNIK